MRRPTGRVEPAEPAAGGTRAWVCADTECQPRQSPQTPQARRRIHTTARFFDKTDAAHLAAQLTHQVCQATGGPCVYEGPTMAEVHAELDITQADFDALVAVLQQSMAARGIAADAQAGVLARLGPMQRDIVTRR